MQFKAGSCSGVIAHSVREIAGSHIHVTIQKCEKQISAQITGVGLSSQWQAPLLQYLIWLGVPVEPQSVCCLDHVDMSVVSGCLRQNSTIEDPIVGAKEASPIP